MLVKMREIDDERMASVKMKMFGVKTRSVHEWHPAKQLAKRFNVPDPYPSSNLLGVPHLQVFFLKLLEIHIKYLFAFDLFFFLSENSKD